MRYANFCDQGRTNINIGDYLQFMAISNLYKRMRVPAEDIYYIGQKDTIDYRGEEILLPINNSIHLFLQDGKIAISPHITPVFLGVVITTANRDYDIDAFLQDKHNHDYFLSHSPVGCRDEATYAYFMKYDIPAYINGCLTATFPKAEKLSGESIIFADAPKNLLKWVPNNILDANILFTTQQFQFNEEAIKDYHKIFDFVRAKYEYYMQNARLIITSRLHVALPCAAFGIPVVLAKDIVDTRFSFIEQYLPIYCREQYKDIDWNPKAPNFEAIKEQMTSLAISRIEAAMSIAKNGRALTAAFKTRNKQNQYHNSYASIHKTGYRFDEYAKKHWALKKGAIQYALWGVSADTVEYWRNHVESQYPNAQLTAVFDRYKHGKQLGGITLINPDAVADMPDICIVVCAVSAVEDALKLFKRLNIRDDRYIIATDRFISEDDIDEKRLAAK